MNTKIFRHFFLFLIVVMMVSCVVSKKKYVALSKQKAKSIDSLETIVNKVMEEFDSQKYAFNLDKTKKLKMLDSADLEVRRLAKDTTSLKNSLRDAINEYKREQKKLVNIEKDMIVKRKQIDSLSLTLTQKQNRLVELENMLSENQNEIDKLRDAINLALNSFDKSELTVYQKDGKVYVSMEEKLMFKVGSALIDKKGEDAVKKIGEVLDKNQNIDILVEGHTDNTGSAEINWKLSTERALSIVSILQNAAKIDPKRITASGRGMYAPVADNTTDAGKQKNRRIEIILVPKLESLYKLMNDKK